MRVYRRMRGCGGTGRRTSLRSWRATVGVQIPSSALFCRTKRYACNCDDTIQLRTYQNKGVVGAGKRSKVNILEMFLALLEMMRLICRKMTEKVSFFVCSEVSMEFPAEQRNAVYLRCALV